MEIKTVMKKPKKNSNASMGIIRLSVFFVLLLFLHLPVFSQSNELIDSLLGEKYADFGKSAYLVLAAAGLVDRELGVAESGRQAIRYLGKVNWGKRLKVKEKTITLGEFSYIVMKAFGMSGGIMYSLFPSPRYASRELYYLGFIDGSRDPYRRISGEEAVTILQRVLEWKEGSR